MTTDISVEHPAGDTRVISIARKYLNRKILEEVLQQQSLIEYRHNTNTSD